MSAITFPTRPASHHTGRSSTPGLPTRAVACRCTLPFLHDGGCERCGHWTAHTIATTWANRAREIAARRSSR